jgi:hypothetical protein
VGIFLAAATATLFLGVGVYSAGARSSTRRLRVLGAALIFAPVVVVAVVLFIVALHQTA